MINLLIVFITLLINRTISWNHAPNGDKQWLLRNTVKMSTIHEKFTDFLNAKRLQTLQSVDESVNQIYEELKKLNELGKVFMFFCLHYNDG